MFLQKAYGKSLRQDVAYGSASWATVLFFYNEEDLDSFFKGKDSQATMSGIVLKKQWSLQKLDTLGASMIIDDWGKF